MEIQSGLLPQMVLQRTAQCGRTVMKYDCLIQVRFLATAEGGKAKAVKSNAYGAPIIFEGQAYESR